MKLQHINIFSPNNRINERTQKYNTICEYTEKRSVIVYDEEYIKTLDNLHYTRVFGLVKSKSNWLLPPYLDTEESGDADVDLSHELDAFVGCPPNFDCAYFIILYLRFVMVFK